MQRTLEDQENYETTSIDVDLNPGDVNRNRSMVRDKEEANQSNSIARAGSGAFHSQGTNQIQSSSDEASVTEKHDCNAKALEENNEDTQEVEFNGAQSNLKGAFGSDINGFGTASVSDEDAIGTEQIPDTQFVGTSPIPEGCPVETERILETESLELQSDRNINPKECGDTMKVDNDTNDQETPKAQNTIDLNRCDTMEVDNDANAQEAAENAQNIQSQSNSPMEDTEGGGTIRTSDLLASEVAGSWACSTAPSVHEENDSSGSKDYDDEQECPLPVQDSSSLVAESQHIPLTKSETAAVRRDHERRALSEMIGIVAPDLREQFSRAVGSDDRIGSGRGVASDSDTEGCSDADDDDDGDHRDKDDAREASDAETIGSDRAVSGDGMDGDDGTQDSVG